jgi:hypothetical protein
MASVPGYTQVSGNGQALQGTATLSVIAAQGAGKVIRITRGCISVTTAAAAGGGLVRICDGTTTIMQWDANAVKDYYFDFGDVGYPLTANTAFQLIVSGAGGNQATANIAAVGIVA